MSFWFVVGNLTISCQISINLFLDPLCVGLLHKTTPSGQTTLKKPIRRNKKASRLSGARDKTIYHVINEWSELAQKEYKTRHDWVGKLIH